MMNPHERYEEAFAIASSEADLCGKLSLFALFNRFQDLAGIHATQLQAGYEVLREKKLAWILSRIKVQIHSFPHWGETVRLATWPKGIDRLFALRDFCMSTDQGKPLIAATSAWLLIDLDKGRPRRIETLPVDLQFPRAPHALQDRLEKIQIPDGVVPVFEKPVWLSDIDVNRHVNNAQYVKWITDCFSQSQFCERRITSVQINYLEETLLGDTIVLLKMPEDISANEYYVEGVNRSKGTQTFHARITWE
jgi:medium-chain acyl-[acyl-carrier-protein] hydrolase